MKNKGLNSNLMLWKGHGFFMASGGESSSPAFVFGGICKNTDEDRCQAVFFVNQCQFRSYSWLYP